MHWTVDRLEGDWAILECPDQQIVRLPRNQLPADLREGDLLQVTFTINHQATTRCRQQMNDRIDDFFTNP
ncbi:DUF3006 domain-containing protein [Heliophilum fasciatum]|uniref:DUF3006 family protein n=1 Tax=Heliophilum fasciatum TaxID=35700 RepID=A0A4R2RI66_9FIRM|nr:DUF3006 domain-containing protein [Heliophilum fasciatum]MCW2278595.1 hypothetical protein [Heliophilum fasciatum]TCP62703.1 DUF3006 family protein [Heliophilum fasciatum]